MKQHLIVIGGGAAGFFCAVNAARLNSNLQVTILEKTNKLLSKVKVSGGGRCNVTHACFSIADMAKQYPRGEKFLKKSFHHFFTTDTITWFQERGIALKTEQDGRMFPVSDSSQTIIDCLLHEAERYNVDVMTSCTVQSISHKNNTWHIETNKENFIANCVCISAGGMQKAEQENWLHNLQISLVQGVPSLFTFNIPNNKITSLMGLSVPHAQVKIAGEKIQHSGPLLVTHWGLSGPAVLKTSAFAAVLLAQKNYNFTALVNWLPSFNENTILEKLQSLRFSASSKKMKNANEFNLPTRLWEFLLAECEIDIEKRFADVSAKEQAKLAKILCNHQFLVKGKTTFKEEFVTAGGVALENIDFNTMACKLHPNLYFAGEILNIDGVTGGFNFQNAWTTGFIAAKAIAASAAAV
jgi:predicted Rossmann fold flavoprotein